MLIVCVVGVAAVRKSRGIQKPLPNSRVVSNEVTKLSLTFQGLSDGFSVDNSLFTFAYGQLVDHDLTRTPAIDSK